VWSDEFGGTAGANADSSKWVYETGNGSGGWGNSELEYYRSQNGVLDGNGNLVITAKQESYDGFNYTSVRLKTQGKSTWTYGHIESRIRIPYGQGVWPAFWLLGDDIGTSPWPACGEIDVMENIGKEPNMVHGTMHGPGYSGAAGPTASYTLPGSGKFADDFHVFAIEWETDVIRWYVDATLYSTKTPADIGSGNTWVFDQPFFIMLNFAVGGTWPGNPDGTTPFPQTMTVDYVRVCQR
jgi:beta-glucanase (GH16 family)